MNNTGFFSNVYGVLGLLDSYEKKECAGLIIKFQKNIFYSDPEKNDNWWNYYFEPLEVGNTKASHKIIEGQLTPNNFIVKCTRKATFQLPKQRIHELITKYIKVLPFIQQKVDLFYQDNLQGFYVIGVHYRGTDKMKLETSSIPFSKVEMKILQVIQDSKIKNYKIFIATDQEDLILYMKQKFGNKIVFADHLRAASTINVGIHYLKDKSNFIKGQEALIDALLLAKSNILIKTSSNLSDFAAAFSVDMPVIELNAYR